MRDLKEYGRAYTHEALQGESSHQLSCSPWLIASSNLGMPREGNRGEYWPCLDAPQITKVYRILNHINEALNIDKNLVITQLVHYWCISDKVFGCTIHTFHFF
jgi:hypothetical protein